MADLKYKRVLLKLSGEALAGQKGIGFDFVILQRLATEITDIAKMGASIGLVIGGGNIVRGAQLSKMGMERAYLIGLVQKHDDIGHADLPGQENVFPRLGHGAVCGAHHQDGHLHCRFFKFFVLQYFIY